MQEIRVEVEDETSSASAHTQISTDQHDRGHPDVIGNHDRTISGSEDTSSRSETAVTERDRNDPQELDLVMIQTSTSTSASQRQGPIMTGSHMIPERLPMARLNLGQVLRNQLEHRRRAASQTQPANTNAEPYEDVEFFGQGIAPSIAGTQGPNYYGLHTASWNTWMSELAAPDDTVYQPNMEHPCFWRYPD